MEILNVGLGEMIVIFVIALLVFGPERLPEMARRAGKVVRDLQAISGEFTQIINESMAEVEEPIQETRKTLTDASSTVSHEIKRATDSVQQSERQARREPEPTTDAATTVEPENESPSEPEEPDETETTTTPTVADDDDTEQQ